MVGKWSAIVFSSVILLVGAVSRLELVNLLWAAAPLIFLGLLDAGYLARERRCLEQLRAGKNGDDLLPPASAVEEVAGFLRTLAALSIWPFYLGLFGVILAGGRVLPQAVVIPVSSGLHEGGLTGVQPGSGPMARPNLPALSYPSASPRPVQLQGIPPRPMVRQVNPLAPGQSVPLPPGQSVPLPAGSAGANPQNPPSAPGAAVPVNPPFNGPPNGVRRPPMAPPAAPANPN